MRPLYSRARVLILSLTDYVFLAWCRCVHVDGVSDSEGFDKTADGLDALGLSTAERDQARANLNPARVASLTLIPALP